jgi:hypothetical protein
MNLYWPAKTFTMNSTKITTFKPTIQNPNDEKSTNQLSQVTNEPDIDEYTTDIW